MSESRKEILNRVLILAQELLDKQPDIDMCQKFVLITKSENGQNTMVVEGMGAAEVMHLLQCAVFDIIEEHTNMPKDETCH